MSEKAEYDAERKVAFSKLKELLPLLMEVSDFYYNINYSLEYLHYETFESRIFDFIQLLEPDERRKLAALISEFQYGLDVIVEENPEDDSN